MVEAAPGSISATGADAQLRIRLANTCGIDTCGIPSPHSSPELDFIFPLPFCPQDPPCPGLGCLRTACPWSLLRGRPRGLGAPSQRLPLPSWGRRSCRRSSSSAGPRLRLFLVPPASPELSHTVSPPSPIPSGPAPVAAWGLCPAPFPGLAQVIMDAELGRLVAAQPVLESLQDGEILAGLSLA